MDTQLLPYIIDNMTVPFMVKLTRDEDKWINMQNGGTG
jgi:hypothetical protein